MPIVRLVLAAALGLGLLAQPVEARAQTRPSLDTLAGGLSQLYQSVRRNLIEAAEAMPEELYGFRPVADVRTFGQIVGHVANAQYNFCASGSTQDRPATGNAELLTSKAELVAALHASFEFCDRAYAAAGDDQLHAESTFGSASITRGYALVYNVAHDNEHYGNIVTYMRINGLVPPSSARGSR